MQVVSDNFDCNISSMNDLKQTHSLAMMMLQTEDENCEEQYKIKRITAAELKDKDLLDINFVQCKGSKNPAMPKKGLRSVLSLSIIAEAVIFSNMSSEFDFEFLKMILMIPNKPEYLGFNEKKLEKDKRCRKKLQELCTFL